MAIKTKSSSKTSDTYFELIREFPLKAIHSERQYDAAVDFFARLDMSGRTAEAGCAEYAEVLLQLISAYDDSRGRIDLSHIKPVDSLKFLVKESGMSVTALGKLIGSQGTASQILRGERELSKANIRKLADHFKVNPGLFL